jgi:ribosomal protein S18 acetylase RimI-like enzyme
VTARRRVRIRGLCFVGEPRLFGPPHHEPLQISVVRHDPVTGLGIRREVIPSDGVPTPTTFAVTWCDELNRTGLMEGVGTHVDHRQIGLGRAVVRFAAHHMAAGGMEYATVANSESNAASFALYRSAGFGRWQVIDGYVKQIGWRATRRSSRS